MPRRFRRVPLFLSFLVQVFAEGCTTPPTPLTAIRRTAFVGAPRIPSRVGTPLHPHELRIQGEANPLLPAYDRGGALEEGDPGLLIPRVQLGGSIYGSPVRGLELGGQLRYAALTWTERNLQGVPRLPGRGEEIWSGGFGIRANLELSQIFSASFLGEIEVGEYVQAEYRSVGSAEGSVMELSEAGSEVVPLPTWALIFAFQPHEIVGFHLSGVLGTRISNIGLEIVEPGEEPEGGPGLHPYFLFCAGAELSPGVLVMNADAFVPVGVDGAALGLGLAFRIGLRFDLGSGDPQLR